MQSFSIKEALAYGWEKMKNHYGFFWLVAITFILALIGVEVLNAIVAAGVGWIGNVALFFIVAIVFIIFKLALQLTLDIGLLKVTLELYDDGKSGVKTLFNCYPLLFKYIGASLLCLPIVLPAVFIWFQVAQLKGWSGLTILLVIIGLVVSCLVFAVFIRVSFYRYFIVDMGSSPVDSLKSSWALTKGCTWNLIGFYLTLGLINIVGILCLIIGLSATVPTSLMAVTFVYRKLLAQLENQHGEEALNIEPNP